MDRALSIRNIIDIILKTVNKSINILADMYLNKDVSIIYKWKTNKVSLKSRDIERIVHFAISESTLTGQKIMRSKIQELVEESELQEDMKNIIIGMEDFEEFLKESLNAAISISQGGSSDKKMLTYGKKEDHCIEENHEKMVSKKKSTEEDGEECYSGVVKFDLLLNKGTNSKNKKRGSKIHIKDINFNETEFMTRIYKYVQNKMSLGVILVVVISGFVIANAAGGNRKSEKYPVAEAKPTSTIVLSEATGNPKELSSNDTEITQENTNFEKSALYDNNSYMGNSNQNIDTTDLKQTSQSTQQNPSQKSKQIQTEPIGQNGTETVSQTTDGSTVKPLPELTSKPEPVKDKGVSNEADINSNNGSTIYYSNINQGNDNKIIQGNNSYIIDDTEEEKDIEKKNLKNAKDQTTETDENVSSQTPQKATDSQSDKVPMSQN